MDCRKHNHQGNKGVCASCLRDKLSLLPNTTPYYTIHRFSSSSSSPPTVSSSPVKDHRRAGSMSRSLAVSGHLVEGILKKSRSMAHVPRGYIVGDSKKKTTEKKTGFWTKLFNLKGKGGGGADVGGFVTSRQRAY